MNASRRSFSAVSCADRTPVAPGALAVALAVAAAVAAALVAALSVAAAETASEEAADDDDRWRSSRFLKAALRSASPEVSSVADVSGADDDATDDEEDALPGEMGRRKNMGNGIQTRRGAPRGRKTETTKNQIHMRRR